MKICYVGNARSVHIHRFVDFFAARGHEVHVVSPWAVPSGSLGSAHVHSLPRPSFRPRLLAAVFRLFLHAFLTRKLIRHIRPDILHAHYIVYYGFLAALSGFRPLILSAWGSDILAPENQSRLSRRTMNFSIRRADLILTTSPYLRDYTRREFGLADNAVMALPWGVDLDLFRKGYEHEAGELRNCLGIARDDFVVLSPRAMKPLYRIDRIVESLPDILRKHPDVTLILLKGAADDSHYEAHLDALAADLGVTGKMRVIRRELTPREMAILYNLSDAFVSIPRSDQFGSTLQEAMACGLVPIVADLEVYHMYLQDGRNALFVDDENTRSIAEKVVYCIENPSLKNTCRELNRRIIEENEDWNRNAETLDQIYQNLVEQRRLVYRPRN